MSDIIDAKKTILEAFSTERNFRDNGIRDGIERLVLLSLFVVVVAIDFFSEYLRKKLS